MSIKVLLIEDDRDIARLITKMLDKAFFTTFEVTHAPDMETGKKLVRQYDYDCVLLDLYLSNSAGLETFKECALECPFTPIVIVSGYTEDGVEAVRCGAQDFIPKTEISPSLFERSIKYAIERHKLEVEKINAEVKYSNIITNTPLGVHMYELQDEDLYFCGYNPAADNILGIDHKSLIGIKIEDAFRNVGIIKNEYISVIKTGEGWTNKKIAYDDGKIKGVYSISAFKIEKNKVATIFQDITQRVESEEELKRTRERFKLLSESTFEGVAITKHGKFIDANRQFCKMVRADLDYIIGKDVTEFVASQDKDIVLKTLLKKSESPYEHMACRKDGSMFPVEIHGRTLSDGMRLTAVRDMTRYHIAEEQNRIIFIELECRIQQWRNEMTEESRIRKDEIQNIVGKIQSMTSRAGAI